MSAYVRDRSTFNRVDFRNDTRGVNGPESQAQQVLNQQILLFARDLNQAYGDIKSAHEDVHKAYLDTIRCLMAASEFKDSYTGSHLKRIGEYSVFLAEELGMAEEWVENLRFAAPMHDIGKVGIPDRILMKPGKLTKKEFTTIKKHTTIGAKILSAAESDILQMARDIALTHHENWNGTGYPGGLQGPDIPLEGRIVALCDYFDALTSRRPYREAFPVDTVIGMIREEEGQKFDPRIVEAFFACLAGFKELLENNGPAEL